MKNQVKRFTQFINENYQSEYGDSFFEEPGFDNNDDTMAETSQCCGSEIDEEGYCTACGEESTSSQRELDHAMHSDDYDAHRISRHNMNRMSDEELYEAKKKAQIDALKEVDKKFANLKPAAKKKGKAAEEEEMEEAPKRGAKPAAKGNPFGKPAAKGITSDQIVKTAMKSATKGVNPFAKKDEKPAAKGMPFGKPAAKGMPFGKPAAKPFGFQKKGANKENEM
jgi:hypothetical protein